MKFYKFSSLAFYSLLIFSGLSEATVKNNENSSSLDMSLTVTCGGVINYIWGAISYKPNETLLQNERCVWIIRAPDAGKYDVYLFSLGIPGSLIISAFGYQGNLSTIVPRRTAPDGIYIPDANVLAITLYTGPENNTEITMGFSLQYVGASTSGQPISERSTHNIISAGSGHHQLPRDSGVYDVNELSTFVVTPFLDSSGNFLKTEVLYHLKSLESCYDILDVYLFNQNLTRENKWSHDTKFCGDVEFATIQNRDLILLVFSSDLANVNAGFHLFTQVDYC